MAFIQLRLFNLIQTSSSSNTAILSTGTCLLYQKSYVHHHMEKNNIERYLGLRRSNTAKANRNTHVNELFARKLRGKKSLLITLPEDGRIQDQQNTMPPSEMRKNFLRKGINPYKDINSRMLSVDQIEVGSLPEILNPYIPPPRENRASWNLLKKGNMSAKIDEKKEWAKHKYQSFTQGIRRIRKKEGFQNFSTKEFGNDANKIYESAHLALIAREKDKLCSLITERCLTLMWPEVATETVVWKLHEFNGPSEVINCTVIEYPPESKSGNEIAQVTVRISSKQSIAIYDRFGHHILGDPNEVKDVVEYVVFENHISSAEGVWRMHGKIYPDWLAINEKQPPIFK